MEGCEATRYKVLYCKATRYKRSPPLTPRHSTHPPHSLTVLGVKWSGRLGSFGALYLPEASGSTGSQGPRCGCPPVLPARSLPVYCLVWVVTDCLKSILRIGP
eukprot:3340961-Rhodomonas_salina.1